MSTNDPLGKLSTPKKIKHPIFIKEYISESDQLIQLRELVTKLKPGFKRDMIEEDIKSIREGLRGEGSVAFELRHAFIPILCLHDVKLQYKDYIAQFDFIVIASKFMCIIETKNLNGDIEIIGDGTFIRTIRRRDGTFIRNEGMYSPIVQNERHVNIIKEILTEERLMVNLPVKSLVIMANPKTLINKEKCSKNIQECIYKHDQIISYMREHQENNSIKGNSDNTMYKIANYLLESSESLNIDHIAKYELKEYDFIPKYNRADIEDSSN